jgi:plasmid stabilization system protein ParE
MIVRYSRRAENDLAKILSYLDERSPRGARNVKLAIKRTIDTIGENPNIGYATGGGVVRANRGGFGDLSVAMYAFSVSAKLLDFACS